MYTLFWIHLRSSMAPELKSMPHPAGQQEAGTALQVDAASWLHTVLGPLVWSA